jgi:hypothetical protein
MQTNKNKEITNASPPVMDLENFNILTYVVQSVHQVWKGQV